MAPDQRCTIQYQDTPHLDEDKGLSPMDSRSFDEELSGNEIHEEEPSEMDFAEENHLQAEIVTVESLEIGPVNNVKATAQHAETHEKRDQVH